jgi:antitoxin CptB
MTLTHLADRMPDRLRWHCRRGMLELDLVLNAFLERHLDALEPREIEAFKRLLALPDPELFDLVMGREELGNVGEAEVLAKIRRANG